MRVLLATAAAAAAAALDLYVAPSGSDAGAGTQASPFATPGRALAAVAAAKAAGGGSCGGDATVHLSAGTWYLPAPLVLDGNTTCGGADATRVVGAGARAAGGADGGTILSAGVVLSGWAAVAPGVWSVPAPTPAGARFVRALFDADAPPPAARRLLARTPIMTARDMGQWGVAWAPGDAPALPPAAYAEGELVMWHQWTNSQNKLAGISWWYTVWWW